MQNKDLVTYQLTPLQAAFIEYCRRHPYSRIEGLWLHEGIPVSARVKREDGTIATVSFVQVARNEGLIPK